MKKTAILILILMIMIIYPVPVLSKELQLANNVDNSENGKLGVIKLNVSTNKKLKDKQFLKNSWEFVKGEPSDNALNLLMFSYHTREDRDQMNESNKLVAIDLDGYTLGTYNNSYHSQTYYAGITRKIYEKNLPEDVNMDFKYKLMAMHGYERYEFNIGGITPLIVPVIGISKGLVGVDFLISPGRTVTFATTFRVNLPEKKSIKKNVF
ncbi:MAG TPA: hypothetical protein HA227_04005 [Candidatus Diapherotrites archaeon]|uniref:Uncharacterized protein n=1 Tax=Candidatus Iainarchaeum sp. TaxID=3101447 RepID=A0A7J4KUA5_9ARCH|nr:hypothetical protein [Candidatus Diapherotrites archaeon]